MNTPVPIALTATVVAAALTWFFCIRPMFCNQRNGRAQRQGRCADPGQAIDAQIRHARNELDRLRAPGAGQQPAPGGGA
ncbi:hypothetical protein ASF64_12970 [Arthrobacter sp. Leaf137]|nr:hypothetical protein ASF64_12970 [Arthrobacter sp. Leaf137]